MKKYIVLSVLAITLISGTAFAKEGENEKNPFEQVWDTIAHLQQQIDNIQLIPGPIGPAGDSGPKGDKGDDAVHGAGNIAFISGERVLARNGTVYIAANNPSDWIIASNHDESLVNINPPIPVTDIADWDYITFVDQDGNFWDYNTALRQWFNVGHPPY